jgi:hypothetical protein
VFLVSLRDHARKIYRGPNLGVYIIDPLELSPLLLHAVAKMSNFSSERVAYWKSLIIGTVDCIEADRVLLLCEFLLRNDFISERGLRHAPDPASWEGIDVLQLDEGSQRFSHVSRVRLFVDR